MKILRRNIKIYAGELISEVVLDIAFPERKNSKTETLKAEILNMERQLELLERGLEDQTYEEYKQEYMSQEPSESSNQSKDDEIADL